MVFAFWLTVGALVSTGLGLAARYNGMNKAVQWGYFATAAGFALCAAVGWGAFPGHWFLDFSTQPEDTGAAALRWRVTWFLYGAPVTAMFIWVGCRAQKDDKDGKYHLPFGAYFNLITTAITIYYLMKWDAAANYPEKFGKFELFGRVLSRIWWTLIAGTPQDRLAQQAVLVAFMIGLLAIPFARYLLPWAGSIFAPFRWLFSLPGRIFRRKKKSGRLMGL